MSLARAGRVVGFALAAALVLTGCGTDDNSTPDSRRAAEGVDASSCATGSLTGAGSSAQKNAMDEWVKNYQTACDGASINYQSAGSGAGIQQFFTGNVDFAGSDAALTDAEQPMADARCGTGKAINLPMVVGPIAVAYRLSGVDDLVLDAPTIARIFSGKLTRWNDPAIARLNPGARLPATTIQALHRADSSGTTANFTAYLQAAAGSDWTYGSGKDWIAPRGQGAKGNEGISASVRQTEGAVGYLELSYVENARLSAAQIDTGNQTPVALTAASAGKAVDAAEIIGTGNDLALKLDYATQVAGAYPIVLVTYEIVCEKGTDPVELGMLKGLFTYTAGEQGQQAIADLGYGQLPARVAAKVRTSVAALGQR